MESKLRPYATAGIALVGASVIAITPIAPPPLPDIRVASPAVQLSASIDPITPWLNVFNTAEVNFADLANTWLEAPAPVLQQIIANQLGYLRELPDFETIVGQVAENLEAVAQTLVGPGVGTGSLDESHEAILELLPFILDVPAALQPVLDFSTTFLSGVLLGLVGPVIGPALALGASVDEIFANLTGEAPDLGAALNTLINTPAAMTDAFLNGGQSLDLTPVLTALGLNLELSPGIPLSVGINFGGLLSPGGSIFNALDLGFVIEDGPFQLAAGQGPGAIGSLIGLSQAIARALGWDGTGNPLAPPLTTPETDPETEAPDPAALAGSAQKSQMITVSTQTETGTETETDAAGELALTTPVKSSTEEPKEPLATVDDSTADDSTDADEVTPTVPEKDAEPASSTDEVTDTKAPGGPLVTAFKKAGDRFNSAVSGFGKRPEKDASEPSDSSGKKDASESAKSPEKPSKDSSDSGE